MTFRFRPIEFSSLTERPRRETGRNAGGFRAHPAGVAVSLHLKDQRLAFRRHVEATVGELVEVPVTPE